MGRRTKYLLALPLVSLSLGLLTVGSNEVMGEQKEQVSNVVQGKQSSIGKNISEMFNNNYADNTWVFVGGRTVQADFEQTQGVRNYVRHFEEYIRWKKSGNEFGRQRYVINTAQKGLTLKTILSDFEGYVGKYTPKAVAFMIGEEEYQQGVGEIANYKVNLGELISHSLALRNNQGFSVIQSPFATADTRVNELIEVYIEATQEVISQLTEEEQGQIVFVNHFEVTDNQLSKEEILTTDQQLNAKGHYEIGKQLSQATIKSVDGYPGDNVTLDLVSKASPSHYLRVLPTCVYSQGKLMLAIPSTEIEEWKYQLKSNGLTLSGYFSGNQIELKNVPQQRNYDLLIQSADGKSQLIEITGQTIEGNQSKQKEPVLDSYQEAIQRLLVAKDQVNWLFMGDSITHGAAWTNGYDDMTDSFEKFLHNDYQREKDVVINTAVSGATVASTLAQIDQRLMKYNPDVVSIMLGTNDLANASLTVSQYKVQLQQLVDKVEEKGAQVILRSPTPSIHSSRTRVPEFVKGMEEVAAANEGCLFINQYHELNQALEVYPYLWQPSFQLFTDGWPLHPGPNGQLVLVKQFIKSLGLETSNKQIENLFYELPLKEIGIVVVPTISNDGQSIKVQKKVLETQVGDNLGEIIVTAKAEDYEYTISGNLSTVTLPILDKEADYEIKVAAYSKKNPNRYEWQAINWGGIDKSRLEQLVIEHEGKKSANYTVISWEVFAMSLEKSQGILADKNAGQVEIDSAYKELLAAAKQLILLNESPLKLEGSALETLKKGKTLELKLSGLTDGEEIEWIVEKGAVASVKQNNSVTGLMAGVTKITGKVVDSEETVSFILRVTR